MIRVTIVDDERIIASVSDIKGKDILMAWAQENEKSPGHSIFSEGGELFEIVDNDDVLELLVRATLNYLDIKGVKIGYCRKEALFDELIKLGFTKKDDVCHVNIEDFFKPCCNHK